MKALVPSLLLGILLTSCSESPQLKPIFNGENLDGWVTDLEAVWSVRDGLLLAQNDPAQEGDILLTAKDDYRNFILELDFKLGEGLVDSGVFLRDTKEQIQIGESGSLKRDMTALAYIPGKGYPVQVDTARELLDKQGWNTLKIQVVSNTYTTWLNGVEIMTYESDTIAPHGPIGLQVHPNREMSITFRNILATELPE